MISFGLILLLRSSSLISHNIHLHSPLSLTNRLQILISMSQPQPNFVADIVLDGLVWEDMWEA